MHSQPTNFLQYKKLSLPIIRQSTESKKEGKRILSYNGSLKQSLKQKAQDVAEREKEDKLSITQKLPALNINETKEILIDARYSNIEQISSPNRRGICHEHAEYAYHQRSESIYRHINATS